MELALARAAQRRVRLGDGAGEDRAGGRDAQSSR